MQSPEFPHHAGDTWLEPSPGPAVALPGTCSTCMVRKGGSENVSKRNSGCSVLAGALGNGVPICWVSHLKPAVKVA